MEQSILKLLMKLVSFFFNQFYQVCFFTFLSLLVWTLSIHF
jgi:hypothetical protein